MRGVILVVLMAGCIGASAPRAHGAEPGDSSATNSLRAGSWSLQFQIGENFDLESFEGSVVSLKRHFSPGAALRLGLSFGAVVSDQSLESESTVADTSMQTVTGVQDHDEQHIEVTLEYLGYPNPDSKMNLFWGVGPFLSLSRSQSDVSQKLTLSEGEDVRSISEECRSWAVGAVALLGVEWFATKAISLHAEYGLAIAYTSWKTERERSDNVYSQVTVDERAEDEWGVNGKQVLFGLSVYF